jgi:DNA-binding FadR family transcriptional regulator
MQPVAPGRTPRSPGSRCARPSLRRSIAQGGLVWEARLTAAFHTLLGTSVPAGPGEAGPGEAASDSASAWGRAHHAFHRTLIDGCAAPWALSLSEALYLHSERYRILHARVSPVDRRDTRAEHRDIFDAALAGDANEAVASLARHYQRTERHVLAQIDRAHAAVEE